ncbi:rifin [Plasmodium sp. gorilla clade G1]|nr:rifin [Plasmodium sp. gorilla clade G1]
MKVHYINILLFALPLNILLLSSQVYNQRNHKSTIPHNTPKIPTNRSLCECELYAPSNYDNDPQMKELLEIFDKQTSQRFEEYEERMKTTRQKCKDQCDKEIQKIILKDKLEKELIDKFATLQTDIQSDAIPKCVCENSVAHKMEKFCLNCGVDVGGGVTLSSGVLGGIGEAALYAWKPKALEVAIEEALKAGATEIVAAAEAAGNARGVIIVVKFLKDWGIKDFCPDLFNSIGISTRYNDSAAIISAIIEEHGKTCSPFISGPTKPICTKVGESFNIIGNINNNYLSTDEGIARMINGLVGKAKEAADATAEIAIANAKAKITTEQTTAINTIFMGKQTTIIASIVAILVIVLIMVIIYLILRYRRKKKMKKKLQYIKLLEE